MKLMLTAKGREKVAEYSVKYPEYTEARILKDLNSSDGCIELRINCGHLDIEALILNYGTDFVSAETGMTSNEYQKLAMRTNDGKMTERLMNPIDKKDGWDLGGILEGCLGLSGESGEMVDLIKKWIFHGKPLDEIHAQKELGDVLWYAALICESFGWQMSDIMELNIEKLRKRYPNGFTPQDANNRKEGDV